MQVDSSGESGGIETYHVVGDVEAKGSSSVVNKCCRVGGESRHTNVHHVAVLKWQGEGRGEEWRFLMLSNVVKFSLNEEEITSAKYRRFSMIYMRLQIYGACTGQRST